jgi:hypothetical protein
MARFESLKHSPSETRRILRERLRRNLATHNDRPPPHRERSEVQDESALALLFDLAIPNAPVARARQRSTSLSNSAGSA